MAALGNKLSLEQLKAPPLVKAQNYCNVCKKCETEDVNFVMLQRIANFDIKSEYHLHLAKTVKYFFCVFKIFFLFKLESI